MQLDMFCIWAKTKGDHQRAISPHIRSWLRMSAVDHLLLVTMVGSPWLLIAGPISLLVIYLITKSAIIAFLVAGTLGFAPWWLWLADFRSERRLLQEDLADLLNQGAVVATRAEYLGGHPILPHGRFVYLTISGYRENPQLSILLPSKFNSDRLNVAMPLLDIEAADEKSEKAESLTETILASLSEKPAKFLGEDRVTLNVKFVDEAGRKQNVELTNFLGGAGEVRNWRNYLICAQAEADTGERPFGPWRSLHTDPNLSDEKVSSNGDARNGSRERRAGSAFSRR